MLFPIYHLLAALAPFAGGQVFPTTISDPLHVAALSVSSAPTGRHSTADDQQCTIVGNLRDTNQRVAIQGLHGPITLHTLGDPAGSIQLDQEQEPFWIDLAPYDLISLHSRTG
jgi:hypothetical protein